MEKAQSQQKIHVSVCNLRNGEKILPLCMNDGYCCPLCSYKPMSRSRYRIITRTATVQHNESQIFRCGLPCRVTSHFHCPYCFLTIDRRDRFVNHLVNHTMTFDMVSSCALAQTPVQKAATNMQGTQAPVRSEDIITCDICNIHLRKKNLRIHLKRKHLENVELISQKRHLRSRYYCDGIPGHCPGCQY